MRPERLRARRGYILLEVIFGAALVSGALIGILDQVASGRAAAIAERRELAANQLVTSTLERARDYWGYGNFNGRGSTSTDVVTLGATKYTRTTVVTPKQDSITLTSTPMLMDYLLVQVTVTYTVSGVVHKVEGGTRAYAEWGQQHVIF